MASGIPSGRLSNKPRCPSYELHRQLSPDAAFSEGLRRKWNVCLVKVLRGAFRRAV